MVESSCPASVPGTYIRTSDGRIFAIRTTGKPKGNEDRRTAASGRGLWVLRGACTCAFLLECLGQHSLVYSIKSVLRAHPTISPRYFHLRFHCSLLARRLFSEVAFLTCPISLFAGSQSSSLESTSNGRHSASSPQLPSAEELTRPISPDSPEIISELQQYAEAAAARESRHSSPSSTAPQGHAARTDTVPNAAARGAEQRLGGHCMAPSVSSALPATSQHGDAHPVLDLRGNKRKSTSPSAPEEQSRRQQKKRQLPSSAQPYEHGYPVSGGFTMPPVSLNHNLTHPFASQPGNSLYMGTGSSYYQLPNLLPDPHLVFPVTTDPLLTAGTASSSAATSATASVPSFMLNPSLAGVLPNYSLPFTQSLLPEPRMFAPFPAPVLPSSLPRSMASAYPGYMSPHSGYPAGGLLRSQVPQFEPQEVPEVGCSSNDEDKDDDVIEITGK